MKEGLWVFFLLATFAALFTTAIFPHLHLVFYAPFLVLLFIRTSFKKSLWIACSCGLIVDLLSSHRLAVHALAYTLITVFLYHQKKFFNDKPINLSLFTLFISICYSILQIPLLFILEKGFNISGLWFFTDLIAMPIVDAIYAFVWFIYPLKGVEKIKLTLVKKRDERYKVK